MAPSSLESPGLGAVCAHAEVRAHVKNTIRRGTRPCFLSFSFCFSHRTAACLSIRTSFALLAMWPGALHLFSQGGEVEAPQSPARPDAAAHARPHLRVTGPAPPDFRLPTGLLSMEICTERCTKGGVGDSVPLGSQSRPRRVPIAHRPGAPACLSGVAGDATSRNPSRFGLAPQTSASARWAQRSRNRSDVDFSRPKVSYQACPSTLRRSESESVCFSSGEEARMENAQACESNPLPAVSETSCTLHRGQNRSAYLTMGSRVKIDFQFCSPVLTPIEHRTRTPSQASAEVAQSKNSFFVGGQREEKK